MITRPAKYFAPGKSKIFNVELTITSSTISVKSEAICSSHPANACVIETPIKDTPLIITMPDLGRIECLHDTSLISSLEELRLLKKNSAYRVENNKKYFIAALLSLLLFVFISVKYVIPASSDFIAQNIPAAWANKFDVIIMEQIEQFVLTKSKLAKTKQDELLGFFHAHGLENNDIRFRRGNDIGANAFALAGNTMIITDELVESTPNKLQLLAIALHEMGHLKHRHLLSGIIRNSTVGLLSLVLIGDLSAGSESITQLGIVLVSRKYARNNETEADAFAVKRLLELNISPKCFSSGLSSLMATHKREKSDSLGALKYLSTHPKTQDRIQKIALDFPNAEECL